jgi:predicted nucleic acid-binding protein
MGLNKLFGKTVYLDTNIFIYALEGFTEYRPVLTTLFAAVENKQLTIATSELTLAECLVKPCKDNNNKLKELYSSFIQTSYFLTVLPVDRECLIKSAELRAEIGVKLPDAIHIASAIEYECEVFLTNDKAIKVSDTLELVFLDFIKNNN